MFTPIEKDGKRWQEKARIIRTRDRTRLRNIYVKVTKDANITATFFKGSGWGYDGDVGLDGLPEKSLEDRNYVTFRDDAQEIDSTFYTKEYLDQLQKDANEPEMSELEAQCKLLRSKLLERRDPFHPARRVARIMMNLEEEVAAKNNLKVANEKLEKEVRSLTEELKKAKGERGRKLETHHSLVTKADS